MSRRFATASLGIAAMIAGASLAFAQPAVNAPRRAPGPPTRPPAKAPSAGEAAYLDKCRYCHIEMGPGTVTLSWRLKGDQALLANRRDLTADYVKTVVRNGINTMPAINRVEVSDRELDQIAAYLSRTKR